MCWMPAQGTEDTITCLQKHELHHLKPCMNLFAVCSIYPTSTSNRNTWMSSACLLPKFDKLTFSVDTKRDKNTIQ